MPLNIDDLRSFILVTNERSVTGAAAKLNVTQQSVSERIRRLEARLGTQLFDRRPHGMQPSPAGFRFLPYATQAVALLDQAAAVIGDDDLIRALVQRDVVSAVLPLLGDLVGDDHVKISVTDDGEEAIVASLRAGDADVGIGVFNNLPGPARVAPGSRGRGKAARGASVGTSGPSEAVSGSGPDRSGSDGSSSGRAGVASAEVAVVAEGVFSDPLIWVVPPDHPLTRRSRALSVTELMPSPGNGSASHGVTAELAGVRVGTRSSLGDELSDGRLVELPVDQPGWVVPISIAYRAGEVDRPALDAVRSALRSTTEAAGANGAASSSPSSGGQT